MVRLILAGGFATGIGMTLLAIAILADKVTGWYAYLASVVCVGIVIVCAVVNSLTTWTGFVHPDDKLWSNILAYLITIFTILTVGRFAYDYPNGEWLLNILFNTGAMLVLSLILLFGLVGLSGRFKLQEVLEGVEAEERAKEVSSRLILFSLVIGGFMALIYLGIIVLYWYLYEMFLLPLSYYYISVAIGGIATLLVISLGLILSKRYEAVAD